MYCLVHEVSQVHTQPKEESHSKEMEHRPFTLTEASVDDPSSQTHDL